MTPQLIATYIFAFVVLMTMLCITLYYRKADKGEE
jgi:hypothetical protein